MKKATHNGTVLKISKKYVPTPEQARIILNYFLHNNFQVHVNLGLGFQHLAANIKEQM